MSAHLVHFYNGDYPVEEACDFIAAGMSSGDTCILMLTQTKRQAVEALLDKRGVFSPPTGHRAGRYVAMDTHEVLSRLMVDGRLDKARATAAVEPLLNAASHGCSGGVRLLGDPAAELLAAGNEEDAFALERLVGELATVHAAPIFCAYSMHDLYRESDVGSWLKLCAEHSSIGFPKAPWIHGFIKAEASVGDDRR